ncbi:ABC transporter permease [Paenibacillus guangzhouensis]|uniref:ABC transporter permease n=1 Tax=Paenibacillus guangzhouensis TaxID=1473112 RepID=UPI00187B9FF7|nr:ABC transporter permease [Paenibacillus guangzhouensis]
MHAFRRLLLTEIRNRRNVLWVIMSSHMLLNIPIIFLTANTSTAQLSYLIPLNMTLLSVMLILPFLRCFSIWRDEWKQQAIYQLFALPVPRSYLLLTKSLVILLEAGMIFAITVISLWIQYVVSDGHLFRAEPLTTINGPKLLFIISIVMTAVSLILLCTMSLFMGHWIGKLPLLLTFISFVAGLLVGLTVFAFFPSFLTILALCLLLTGINVYLLEKKVHLA